MKRKLRSAERQYKNRRTSYAKNELKTIRNLYKAGCKRRKQNFFGNNMQKDGKNVKKVINQLNYLLDDEEARTLPSSTSDSELANDMAYPSSRTRSVKSEKILNTLLIIILMNIIFRPRLFVIARFPNFSLFLRMTFLIFCRILTASLIQKILSQFII